MADQPNEYYEKFPGGFQVASGVPGPDKVMIDYAVATDHGQGFSYTQEGNKYDVTNQVSYDLSGCDTKNPIPSGQPSKVIRAKTGNISIEALSGDIILRAKNIRIIAEDGSGEVTIQSGKNITIKGPVANIDSTNVNVSAKNNIGLGGGSVETFGKTSVSQVKGTDVFLEPINSFLSGAYKWFKKFVPFL
jgi:hypothetical protein